MTRPQGGAVGALASAGTVAALAAGQKAEINLHGAVYEGSVPGARGDRKPPSSAQAAQSPVLHLDDGRWTGGMLWDGRATGWRLGSPVTEQALGPLLSPMEQALRDEACVVQRVSRAPYAGLYASVHGRGIFAVPFPADIEARCAEPGGRLPPALDVRALVQLEHDRIGFAIAAYEGSSRSGAYSSKRAPFTDFSYDNLGAPRNPEKPVYQRDPAFVDPGLGHFLGDASEGGKVKVPTLRNVDRRPDPGAPKAYLHNGVFKSLEEVVHCYDTRDVLPRCEVVAAPVVGENCWPAPEVAANVNTDELGDLGLTPAEEGRVSGLSPAPPPRRAGAARAARAAAASGSAACRAPTQGPRRGSRRPRGRGRARPAC